MTTSADALCAAEVHMLLESATPTEGRAARARQRGEGLLVTGLTIVATVLTTVDTTMLVTGLRH